MSVNVVDVLLLLGVAAFSILGAHRGLAAQALSLGGLVVGAIVGSFVAPLFLPDNSAWLPVAGLAGALSARRCWAPPPPRSAARAGLPLRAPALSALDRIGGIVSAA